MRVTPAEPAQPDRLEQGVDLAAAAPTGPVSASREPEADVARHRQVREQAAFLRDVADPAPLRREVDAGAVDQVRLAHEAGQFRVGGLGVQVQRGGALGDLASRSTATWPAVDSASSWSW